MLWVQFMIEDLICFYDTVISSIEKPKKERDNPLNILKLNNKIITLGGSALNHVIPIYRGCFC